MTDLFSPDADLSGMTGGGQLYVSDVIHKAFVEVDEQGTQAAAGTAAGFTVTSGHHAPPVFNADHPFLFIIRDNDSGFILFMGRVVDPSAGQAD